MKEKLTMLKHYCRTTSAAITLAVVMTACSGQPASTSTIAPAAAATSVPQSATAPPTAAPTAAPPTAAAQSATAAPTAAPTAPPTAAATSTPQSSTEAPRFTNPTKITNPFYPVSLIAQSISLGHEGGNPYRTEVTLLPGTEMIAWDGQQVEARVSQYVAYADGQLVEIAYDYFAQADDGSVYYLGEDVSNYQDGKVVDHDGSWRKEAAEICLIHS